MKTETIPQDLWQRHEAEWQAIRTRPVAENMGTPRPLWQRDDQRDGERPVRQN